MNIADRIKNRRIKLGLSVDDVAEKIGKDRATIYRYESNDIKKLPTSILEPLANALETTPAYLMGWKDDLDDIIDLDKEIAALEEQLTDKEKHAAEIFKSLSAEKQEQVLDYMNFLLQQDGK